MPEQHVNPKRPLHTAAESGPNAPAGHYAELRCRTNFSFLEGASHADELVALAVELNLAALAVTDRNTLAGVVRIHAAAKQAGMKVIIGSEITPADAPPLLLWSPDRAAYGRLSRLLTVGRRAAPKGQCRITFDDIVAHAEGLLAGVLLVPLLNEPDADARRHLARYHEVFGDRVYAIVELHRGADDERHLARMLRFAGAIPVVAANDVHYHVRERRPLQEVLTALRLKCAVGDLGEHRFPNAERHLKGAAAMTELFAACPDVVSRTLEVAGRCTFSLDELRYEYPEELSPPGLTPMAFLSQLAWEGAGRRFPAAIPDKVRRLLEHELKLIEDLRYEAYFLTVHDLVIFARSRGILCQGRGSAANSVVCYCLEITSVDPERIDVLFERFISKERDEAPDIDVDFEHERREEVIQYVYQKYGRDRAGMTAECICYRSRSSIRDVGKALGLSPERVDSLAKAADHHHDDTRLAARFADVGFAADSGLGRMLVELTCEIADFPRHLSQHVGGLVITNGPLCDLVPIENAAMADRTVIQWDKNDLDALGILKVDCLALGMLSAIRRCFDLVSGYDPSLPLTLANVPAEDPEVYDMVCKADTMGVFQIESRAQMSMLPRLKPRCFYDLVIEVAIVRPGPIQGDMVHPYLRRRMGKEAVDYPDERIRDVLHKTLGVPIFQEQAMRLAVVAAGFTPGEADQLRRAMGVWRKRGVMEMFRTKLLGGMAKNGYPEEFAARVFRQIQGFGEYGFPESHAAAFALLVYVSAWLKRHHPAAFAAALINSQPMGFYAPAQLIKNAQQHGVQVRAIDINFSDWDCVLERTETGPAIRLGFRLIRGFRQVDAESLVVSRKAVLFTSFDDLANRSRLSSAALQRLAKADAFRSLPLERRTALWRALPSRDEHPLFALMEEPETPVPLPPMSPYQEVLADYGSAGLSLRSHPMTFLRDRLDKLRVVPAAQLGEVKTGTMLRVAGVVLLRQRPSTAKGITFVTLEDETGMINLIVRPQIWERYRKAARGATAMLVTGYLQHEEEIIHLLTTRIEDLSGELASLVSPSRDFR